MDDLLRVCDSAVGAALAAGADEAEAYVVRGRSIEVELQKNDIQIAKSMRADGLGIRIFKNRSLGFAFVNSFDEAGVAESIERAVGIAAAAPPDEHNGLPEPTPIRYVTGIYDDRARSYGVEEAVERAVAMLRVAHDYDPRVTVDGGGLAVQSGTRAVSNSLGVRAAEDGSVAYCVIMGMATDGDTVSSFDYQFDGTRSVSGIDPVAVARKFAENVIDSLGAVKGESFRGPVVLSPKSAAEVISYPIQFSIRASSVQKETSRLAGRLGRRVASDQVSIVDDPALDDGFATQSFDREGVAPSTLPLIESGVLRSYLYDTYTARKDGRTSTGHASGGAGSVPSVSTTNVVWQAGDTSLEDIVAGIDRGVLVTRFSGNVDPVSGDFSGSVKGGRMIRGGKLAEPLCGTMIAGNTFDLLPSITAVSSERERLFSELLPYVRMDAVSITSG
jgi:PmbA protein